MSKFIHETFKVITRFKEFNLKINTWRSSQQEPKKAKKLACETLPKRVVEIGSLSVSILKYRAGGTRSREVGGIQGPRFWLKKKQKKFVLPIAPLQILDFPPTLSLIFYEIVLEYLNTVIINFKDHHNSVALNTACPTRICI